MKIPVESLNKIKDQIISLVEKYNFINNENLELKEEIGRLTAELDELKSSQRSDTRSTQERVEETKQTIDQCLGSIEECLTLVRELQNEPR